jgi:hypothetical protein
MPALDLEVAVLQVLWEDEISPEDYIHQHGGEDARPPGAVNGSYAIVDFIRYAQIPPRRQVQARLRFPTPADQYYVIAQFRDVLQRNYVAVHWFATEDGESRLRLLSTASSGLVAMPRLEIAGGGEQLEEALKGTPLADYFGREITALLRGGLSVAMLRDVSADWEDRGNWSDV